MNPKIIFYINSLRCLQTCHRTPSSQNVYVYLAKHGLNIFIFKVSVYIACQSYFSSDLISLMFGVNIWLYTIVPYLSWKIERKKLSLSEILEFKIIFVSVSAYLIWYFSYIICIWWRFKSFANSFKFWLYWIVGIEVRDQAVGDGGTNFK